jgi:hypothetical protein
MSATPAAAGSIYFLERRMNTIEWGVNTDGGSLLSDSRLNDLYSLVSDFRLGRLPMGWRGNRVFENRYGELPNRSYGYYKEFYLGPSPESGSLHVVLGRDGDVYVTGKDYGDFIQVLHLPIS